MHSQLPPPVRAVAAPWGPTDGPAVPIVWTEGRGRTLLGLDPFGGSYVLSGRAPRVAGVFATRGRHWHFEYRSRSAARHGMAFVRLLVLR